MSNKIPRTREDFEAEYQRLSKPSVLKAEPKINIYWFAILAWALLMIIAAVVQGITS